MASKSFRLSKKKDPGEIGIFGAIAIVALMIVYFNYKSQVNFALVSASIIAQLMFLYLALRYLIKSFKRVPDGQVVIVLGLRGMRILRPGERSFVWPYFDERAPLPLEPFGLRYGSQGQFELRISTLEAALQKAIPLFYGITPEELPDYAQEVADGALTDGMDFEMFLAESGLELVDIST